MDRPSVDGWRAVWGGSLTVESLVLSNTYTHARARAHTHTPRTTGDSSLARRSLDSTDADRPTDRTTDARTDTDRQVAGSQGGRPSCSLADALLVAERAARDKSPLLRLFRFVVRYTFVVKNGVRYTP